MRVGKRGKDLAVRLPVAVVRALDLKPRDEIDLNFSENGTLEVVRLDRPPIQSDIQAS